MKEWLSGIVGEGAANIVGFVLIFAIILGGIFVVLSIIRRFSGGTFVSNGRTRQPRLSVMDAAAVDSRRKLVLIRRDDVEHLLLIGGPTDVVVEQNIVLESRTNARVQNSRIEPEHIERFRQHEVLANETAELPALSVQPQSAGEHEETIQLNSAIEAPVYRKPEPPKAELSQRTVPDHAPARTPHPPVASPAQPVAAPRPEAPVLQVSEPRPQPRPAPAFSAQPRTVQPPRPAPSVPQSSVRAHPAYPLSQVSRGVVSSTSGLAAAPTAATTATANLGNIVPEREPAVLTKSSPPEVSGPAPINQPQVSVSENAGPKQQERIEPVVSFATEEAEQPDNSAEDDMGGLGEALHEAILADLGNDAVKNEVSGELDAISLEDELLSSLDISATDVKSEDTTVEEAIEDEMEKLLGELTKGETRT